MHELGIATSILETVRREAARRPGARVVAVGLRVGEVSGVEADSLRFCFDALVQGGDLAPLRLEIEDAPRRQQCLDCGHGFVVARMETACPACGAARTRCIGGTELEIAYLDVETPQGVTP